MVDNYPCHPHCVPDKNPPLPSLSLKLAELNPFQDTPLENQHQNLALISNGGNVSCPHPTSVKRKAAPKDNTSHLEIEKKDRIKEGYTR